MHDDDHPHGGIIIVPCDLRAKPPGDTAAFIQYEVLGTPVIHGEVVIVIVMCTC